jgi:hypothetical protein
MFSNVAVASDHAAFLISPHISTWYKSTIPLGDTNSHSSGRRQ